MTAILPTKNQVRQQPWTCRPLDLVPRSDTAQLDVLQGVVYPKALGSLGSQVEGEVQIRTQQCY